MIQYAKTLCLSVSCKKKNQIKTNGKLKLRPNWTPSRDIVRKQTGNALAITGKAIENKRKEKRELKAFRDDLESLCVYASLSGIQ